MKICKITEKELDERLELDKRRDSRGFRISYDSLEEAPDGFYDLQNKIRDGLQREFWLVFDNGTEHLRSNPWDSNFFYFNTDMFGSERLVVEMSKEILGDKLVGLVMSYLEKCARSYCVTASVYENMERGAEYLGRFVINLDEIAVEEALADIWSKQVKVMEIDEKKS
ncbi:MAG: hypothetical protein LV481_11480 [Methylacidiphilales bacterium]|nr:hypothetical protein [Candidatus Methylacidiphilales bacterium]